MTWSRRLMSTPFSIPVLVLTTILLLTPGRWLLLLPLALFSAMERSTEMLPLIMVALLTMTERVRLTTILALTCVVGRTLILNILE